MNATSMKRYVFHNEFSAEAFVALLANSVDARMIEWRMTPERYPMVHVMVVPVAGVAFVPRDDPMALVFVHEKNGSGYILEHGNHNFGQLPVRLAYAPRAGDPALAVRIDMVVSYPEAQEVSLTNLEGAVLHLGQALSAGQIYLAGE